MLRALCVNEVYVIRDVKSGDYVDKLGEESGVLKTEIPQIGYYDVNFVTMALKKLKREVPDCILQIEVCPVGNLAGHDEGC